MIKYLKDLVNYYKKFGMTTNIHKVSIDNLNGSIRIIKHPNNSISEQQILCSIRINPTSNEKFGITNWRD